MLFLMKGVSYSDYVKSISKGGAAYDLLEAQAKNSALSYSKDDFVRDTTPVSLEEWIADQGAEVSEVSGSLVVLASESEDIAAFPDAMVVETDEKESLKIPAEFAGWKDVGMDKYIAARSLAD